MNYYLRLNEKTKNHIIYYYEIVNSETDEIIRPSYDRSLYTCIEIDTKEKQIHFNNFELERDYDELFEIVDMLIVEDYPNYKIGKDWERIGNRIYKRWKENK